jgi:radical SAM superfamily enzyme YgiQ (UPF0313 family)
MQTAVSRLRMPRKMYKTPLILPDKAAVLPQVLLISSHVYDTQVMERGRKNGVFVAPPFGLYRLKTYLEANHVAKVDVFDPNLYDDGYARARSLIEENLYDCFGFSPTRTNMKADLDMMWRIRSWTQEMPGYVHHPVFIAGGQGVAWDADLWIKYAPLSAIVLGYGEYVLAEILKNQSHGVTIDTRCLADISGVVCMTPSGLVRANLANPVTTADFRKFTFDHAPTNAIPYRKYWSRSRESFDELNIRVRRATINTVRLFTSSHCSNGCGFCSSCQYLTSVTGTDTAVLRLSAEEVLSIVEDNVRVHQPDAIFFNDDDFLIGDKAGCQRVMQICEAIIKEKKLANLPSGLRLYAQTKARSVTRRDNQGGFIADTELLRVMRDAGFVLLAVGVESFSDHLLKSPSLNKKTPVARAKAALDGILSVGITPLINLIFLPPETRAADILETIDQTARYVRKGAQISLQPLVEVYPGAPVAADIKCPTIDETFDLHQSGGRLTVPVCLLPQDKQMRKVALHVEEIADRVLAEADNDIQLASKYSPQPVRAISYFIAALELMGGCEEKIKRLRGIISTLLHNQPEFDGVEIYAEVDRSIATIKEHLALSNRSAQPYCSKLYVLDDNVFLETRDAFDILPIRTGPKVRDLFMRNDLISIVIGPESVQTGKDHVRRLVAALSCDEAHDLLSLLRNNDAEIHAEVFNVSSAKHVPDGMKILRWQEQTNKALRGKDEVIVGIHQPGYHRHIGFFQKMAESDIFILADTMQFVRRDWQHRQVFGEDRKWLSVPLIKGNSSDAIAAKRIDNSTDWAGKHWRRLQYVNKTSPYFEKYSGFVKEIYARKWESLVALSDAMTRYMAKQMGVKDVRMIRSSFLDHAKGKKKGALIAELVNTVTEGLASRGTKITYLSGRGSGYMDELDDSGQKREKDHILDAGIKVKFQVYDTEKIRQEWQIHPYSAAFSALMRLGPVCAHKLKELSYYKKDGE